VVVRKGIALAFGFVEGQRLTLEALWKITAGGERRNYNSTNMVRTMEDILGVNYLGTNDANARPMSDVFTTTPNLTPYTAIIPGIFYEPPVDPTITTLRNLTKPISGRYFRVLDGLNSLPANPRATGLMLVCNVVVLRVVSDR
jgi:hypothetical protein